MSRDLVQQSRARPPAKRPGASGPGSPKSNDPAASAVTSLASRLEPTTSADAMGRRRPRLWVVLAVVVVLASTGVALVLRRGGDQPTRVAAAGDAAERPAPAPAWPAGFEPPDVQFAARKEWPEEELRVAVVAGWNPEEVHAAFTSARERFAEFLARRGVAAELPRLPMTLLVVPQNVLCDERIYEKNDIPADCKAQEIHYRPGEKTLFVLADQRAFEANLRYAVAVAACLQSNIVGCDQAAVDYGNELSQK
jgi:hypothetical protein